MKISTTVFILNVSQENIEFNVFNVNRIEILRNNIFLC